MKAAAKSKTCGDRQASGNIKCTSPYYILRKLKLWIIQHSLGDLNTFPRSLPFLVDLDMTHQILPVGLFFRILKIPATILYYLYFYIPITLFWWFWSIILSFLAGPLEKLVTLRNSIADRAIGLCQLATTVKWNDICYYGKQAIEDMIMYFWLKRSYPRNVPKRRRPKSTTSEVTHLLAYEEREDDESPGEVTARERVRRAMHNFIPTNPFRATVQLRNHTQHRGRSRGGGLGGGGSGDSSDDGDDIGYCVDMDSPTSFPATPITRARVMSRTSERSDSVIFSARDRLRVEALSASRDEYSRNAALEAQNKGQWAVFDNRQKSDGLVFTCGNHCALKVGRGLCCSCRSMVSIRKNVFVYYEFSITVSGSQTPSLALGLATQHCPLNVMVGSWPHSVGFYSDGQLLVGSRWFQNMSTSSSRITAGTTVGILVYLPDSRFAGGREQSGMDAIGSSSDSRSCGVAIKGSSSFIQQAGSFFTSAISGNFTESLQNLGAPDSDKGKSSASRPQKANKGEQVDKEAMSEEYEEPAAASGVSSSSSNVSSISRSRTDSDSGSTPNQPDRRDRSDRPGRRQSQSGRHNQPVAQSAQKYARSGKFQLELNVNGVPAHFPSQAINLASDIAALNAPLYPTVSLLSEDTRVWCRFCEADIVYRSRYAIGAPPHAKVYCLDGSLLLDEDD